MPVQEIISSRTALSDAVVEATKVDLAEQGLQVDLLDISDISTPGTSNLADLDRAEAAAAGQLAAAEQEKLIAEQARPRPSPPASPPTHRFVPNATFGTSSAAFGTNRWGCRGRERAAASRRHSRARGAQAGWAATSSRTASP